MVNPYPKHDKDNQPQNFQHLKNPCKISSMPDAFSIWLELSTAPVFHILPKAFHDLRSVAKTSARNNPKYFLTNCWGYLKPCMKLQWRQNEHGGVSNHHPQDCLFNRLFRRRSKKTSKLRVTSLLCGNSPVTGEYPAQRASNAENVSIWWRHHGFLMISWTGLDWVRL